jgi:hypothetical protein
MLGAMQRLVLSDIRRGGILDRPMACHKDMTAAPQREPQILEPGDLVSLDSPPPHREVGLLGATFTTPSSDAPPMVRFFVGVGAKQMLLCVERDVPLAVIRLALAHVPTREAELRIEDKLRRALRPRLV